MVDAPMSAAHADRTSRAVQAAVDAGRALGLDVREPRILHDMFSVVVHLTPSPVVARVPTVLPSTTANDPEVREAQQQRELDVTNWLATQGFPVITPSDLVPSEPVRRDGFSMTFWTFVDIDTEAGPDYVRNAAATAGLHAALRDYPGEPPFLSMAYAQMFEDNFADLAARPDLLAPADLDRARAEWEILAPVVGSAEGFAAEFPGVTVQPVHGDAPAFNLVPTPNGPLFADFELISTGPPEWDLAMVGPEGVAAYNEAAIDAGVRQLDERVLRVVEAAGMLQGVACLALAPQLPMLEDAMAPLVEQWRESPLAGGLG